MPDLIADALAAAGVDLDDAAADAPARPGLPGALRRRQHASASGTAARRCGHEIARHVRPRRRRGVRRLLRLAARALRARDAALHRPQLRLAARPAVRARRPPPAAPARRVRPARARPSAASSPTSGCTGCSASRRMYAGLAPDEALALYAVITYMDTRRGRLVPRGRHARRAAGAGRRGREGRRRAPLRRDGRARSCADPTPAAVAGVAAGRRRAAPGRRRRLHPRPAGRLRPLLPGAAPRRGRVRAGDYSPSAVVWHVGVPGRAGRRTRRTTTSTSATEWDGAFDALLERGELMPDPSLLVTVPVAGRPDAGARPAARRSTCWSRCRNLRRPGRLARARRGPMRERLHGFLGRRRLPDRHRRRGARHTRWTGSAQGMAAGTPFALAHTFVQTGPFRPPNVERRVPGPGLRRLGHRARASACRWCWSRGKLAAAARAAYLEPLRPVTAARVRSSPAIAGDALRLRARATAAARGSPARYGTTYYWGAALLPGRAAPARLRRLRAVPARRRHRRRPRADARTAEPARPPRALRRLRATASARAWPTAAATTRCWRRSSHTVARAAASTPSASTASSARWRWT